MVIFGVGHPSPRWRQLGERGRSLYSRSKQSLELEKA